MTLCVENPKEPTKKIYRTYQNTIIRDFSKAAEYTVNIKNSNFYKLAKENWKYNTTKNMKNINFF